MKTYQLKNKIHNGGFTLVEMLVTLSIIAILATVFLGNRTNYSERLSLKNQTYIVALALRQAQVYSLGVKGNGSPATFNTSYGVHFDSAYPSNEFRFFTDQNGNGAFDSVEPSETMILANGVILSSVCGNNGANCYSTSGSFKKMSITFKRPQSAAIIKFMTNGGTKTPGVNPPAVINLRSQTGILSSIKVESTGGISIQGI
jgi:prepilin-type N-terminal cleavage/methylation domain-containing protein